MAADADRQRHCEKQAEWLECIVLQSATGETDRILKGGRPETASGALPASVDPGGRDVTPGSASSRHLFDTACSLMLTGDYQGRCERSPKRKFIFGSLKNLRFPDFGVGKTP
jgi:hypothetical protein